MNNTEKYLESIDGIYRKEVPADVIARVKQSLADYLAVTCAGAKFQEDKLAKYFEFAEPESGKYRAIGTGRDLALKDAAFLNGLNAHALDYDDGTNSGIIHLGSPVFSLLIPLAQKFGISMADMLRAAVTGYEASYTMAVSIQPGHKARGFHATGTCGTLGAALAASYMLGFTEEERRNAFSTACVAASGMLKALDDGSELKPYNVAKTTLLALTALQLAKAGFKGSPDPLGGRGFIRMMTGKDDIELKPVMLNGTYAVMKSYTKPYASCRYTHPAVEAAIRLREKVSPEEIEAVDIRTYDLAVSGHDHTEIPGSYSAKMSIPYASAAGFIFGRAGLNEFSEEAVRDAEILGLTRKISVTADEGFSEAFPAVQTATVTVRTADGEYTERVDFPKGEPENPMNEDEFKERYDGLMGYAGVGKEISDRIYSIIQSDDADVSQLVSEL